MFDLPRFLLLLLIGFNTYQTFCNPDYKEALKVIKLLPRVYLVFYYIFVLTGWYKATAFESTVITGTALANGVALMFLADIYTQWANRKYGRS